MKSKVKALIVFVSLFVSQLAFAKISRIDIDTTGTIKFMRRATVSCRAAGCPQSESYFVVVLENTDIYPGKLLAAEDLRSPLGLSKKPSVIRLSNLELREGMVVRLKGKGVHFDSIDYKEITAIQDIEVVSEVTAEQESFSCRRPSEKPGGAVKGYVMDVRGEIRDGKQIYVATLYPDCPACMVRPSYLTFDSKTVVGNVATYEGSAARLSIILESRTPTRTHIGRLFFKSEKLELSYTCVF